MLGPFVDDCHAVTKMTPRLTTRILLLAVIVLCSVQTQSDAVSPRIGVLIPTTPENFATSPMLAGLRQGLREHGYVEGTNIAFEYRFAYGQFDRLPDLARELIGLRVDVLVALTAQATIAAKDNTKTIPIVMAVVSDPVASGVVATCRVPVETSPVRRGWAPKQPVNGWNS